MKAEDSTEIVRNFLIKAINSDDETLLSNNGRGMNSDELNADSYRAYLTTLLNNLDS